MGMFCSSIAARRSSVGRISPAFESTYCLQNSNTQCSLAIRIYLITGFLMTWTVFFPFFSTVPGRARKLNLSRRSNPRWWHSCFGPSLSLLKDQGSLFHGEESSVRRRFLQVLRWTHNSFVLTSQCYVVSSAVPPSWWKERQASSRQQNQCSLSDREALMSFDSGGC